MVDRAAERRYQGGGLYLHHCGFEHCAPLHSFGPAIRDHYLVHCVLAGRGEFQAGGQTYRLRAGQAFLIVPGVVTTYTADRSDPWYYGWVGFHGSDAARALRLCGAEERTPLLAFGHTGQMEEALEALNRCLGPDCNPFALAARLYDVLSLLYRPEAAAASERDLFARAADLVEKNYSYELSVEQLAADVGLSRSQLFRIFKGRCGLSPQQYLIQYRLERAAELLSRTALTVTEAMYSSGFHDLPSFSRQFRRRFGASPSQWQRAKAHPSPSPDL